MNINYQFLQAQKLRKNWIFLRLSANAEKHVYDLKNFYWNFWKLQTFEQNKILQLGAKGEYLIFI